MRYDLTGVMICKDRLERLIEFLFKISDRVEVVHCQYNEMTKQEYEAARIEGKIQRRKLGHLNGLSDEKFEDLGFIQRKVTCKTHCTSGGPAVVYTLTASEKLKEYFLKMELLTWPLKDSDGNILADDPAFYKNGQLVCSVYNMVTKESNS